MMRALRRAGLAFTRADRQDDARSGGSAAARDAVIGMQVRWLEIVGREAAIEGRRPPRLSLIPAPVAAQVGGRRTW